MPSPKSKAQSPKPLPFYASRIADPLTFHVSRFTYTFSLIEIMIVVGIMGLLLTISVPIVYKVWHRAPLTQATSDAFEVLSNARARSILQGKQVNVLFHPKEQRFEVEGAGGTQAGTGPAQAGFMPGAGSGTAAKLSGHVRIQMLDINKLPHDFFADELARVRFFPNGTSDELTLILQADTGEQRGVTLEITTGLASVLNEADLQKLRNGSL